VVSDGYTGNVALKSVEGCGKAISGILKREFKKNLFSKLRALLVMDVIKKVKKSADYETMGGAVFLGLTKPVIKAHGNSKAYGFSVCIRQAVNAVRGDMVGKIKALLEKNAVAESDAAEENAE
ncbi:MAG: phosphate--acyl-ACP acyltransferase, partial [Candidatus Scatosoma sp.]